MNLIIVFHTTYITGRSHFCVNLKLPSFITQSFESEQLAIWQLTSYVICHILNIFLIESWNIIYDQFLILNVAVYKVHCVDKFEIPINVERYTIYKRG